MVADRAAATLAQSVLLVVLLAFLGAACDGSGIDDRLIATPDDTVLAPSGCGARPGGVDDLTAEPTDWLQYGEYVRWSDRDRCPVRVDVVAHVRGPEHCGWAEVDFLTVGDPVGTPITESARSYRYYWDPTGALADQPVPTTGSMPVDELPASAYDSGFRLDGTELWFDSADRTVAYRVLSDDVDVWRLDEASALVCE